MTLLNRGVEFDYTLLDEITAVMSTYKILSTNNFLFALTLLAKFRQTRIYFPEGFWQLTSYVHMDKSMNLLTAKNFDNILFLRSFL